VHFILSVFVKILNQIQCIFIYYLHFLIRMNKVLTYTFLYLSLCWKDLYLIFRIIILVFKPVPTYSVCFQQFERKILIE
jgi:hypothetical protein